jgi:hypothetical protein
MAEKFVIQESTNALFIDSKRLHGELHSIKRSRLPYVIDREVVGTISWNSGLFALAVWRAKLKTNFVGYVVGNFDYIANSL